MALAETSQGRENRYETDVKLNSEDSVSCLLPNCRPEVQACRKRAILTPLIDAQGSTRLLTVLRSLRTTAFPSGAPALPLPASRRGGPGVGAHVQPGGSSEDEPRSHARPGRAHPSRVPRHSLPDSRLTLLPPTVSPSDEWSPVILFWS